METNLPLISVIVPCFNHAGYLDESLESVLNQSFENWECIIVNDGSSDNTEEIALKWTNTDTRFKYVKKENGGLASARNFGIKNSKGKYIFPLDADDYIDKSYFEKAVKILDQNKNIEVLTSLTEHFGYKKGIYKLPDYEFETLLIKNCFIACSFFRRESYEKAGGYDENLKSFEDWDFWISLLKNGGEAYRIPEILYHYRKHASESLTSRFVRDPDYYYSLYNYIYKKNIDLYLRTFPNFIVVYQEHKALKEFNEKIKKSFFFKTYWKLKQLKNKLSKR